MFNIKQLRATFTLGTSSFNDDGNSKVIEGLASEFNIEVVASPDACKCSGKVYGMKLEDIAQLTTLAFDPLLVTNRNVLKLEALHNNTWVTVFLGEIEAAYGDLNNSPDIALVVSSFSGTFANKVTIPATSIKGETSVKDIIEPLSSQAGYTLETTITDSLANVCYKGSIMQQIYQIADSINAKVIIDKDILRVMRIDESVEGDTPLLSAGSGLIGYPTFTNTGISLSCEYDPSIAMQGLIEVDSITPKSSGTWRVIKLSHKLSTNMPNGTDWKSTIEAVYV